MQSMKPPCATNGSYLQRSIDRICKQDIDDDVCEAFRCLSSICDGTESVILSNGGELRALLDKERLEAYEAFLSNLKPMMEPLVAMNEYIETITAACSEAESLAENCSVSLNDILTKLRELKIGSDDLKEKQDVSKLFISTIRLSESSINTITSKRVDDLFLNAVHELENILLNAQWLRKCSQSTDPFNGQPISAGRIGICLDTEAIETYLEIMEDAHETLFIWVQQYCRPTKRDESTENIGHRLGNIVLGHEQISNLFFRALQALKRRPSYLYHCILDITNVRKNLVSQNFYRANFEDEIYRSSIELNFYDPVRYIGDMTVWLHHTAACEKEFFHVLHEKIFDVDSPVLNAFEGISFKDSSRSKDDESPDQNIESDLDNRSFLIDVTPCKLLSNVLNCVASDFFKKTKEVITSKIITLRQLLKLTRILNVFSSTLGTLLGVGENESKKQKTDQEHTDELINALHELRDISYEKCSSLWRSNTDCSLNLIQQDGNSPCVSCPEVYSEAAYLFKELLEVLNAATRLDERKRLQQKVDTFVKHVFDSCEIEARQLPSDSRHLYLLNIYVCFLNNTQGDEYSNKYTATFNQKVERLVEEIVDAETRSILNLTGLKNDSALFLALYEDGKKTVEQSTFFDIDTTELHSFFENLFKLLLADGDLPLQLVRNMNSHRLRVTAKGRVSRNVIKIYRFLFELPQSSGIAVYTPQQLETLLDET